MGKLYGSLTAMVVVFACAMSFVTLSVYEDQWWWGLVGGGILMLFAGMGGVFIPTTLRQHDGGELRTAKAFLQLFGSTCGLLFFIMAMVSWALGKRYIGSDSAYTTLGILILLGLAGVGIQGALAMAGYFTYVRNDAIVAPAREARVQHTAGETHTH